MHAFFKLLQVSAASASIALLVGCSTWSMVDPISTVTPDAARPAKDPALVQILDAPKPGQNYRVIGLLKVTVNKPTIFNPDPTRESVDAKLREEAARVGADAVISVKYSAVYASLLSWGAMDGEGQAVAF